MKRRAPRQPLRLPGLPELLCLEIGIIRVPDEDLYGPRGTAAQMAYTGWIAGVYARWEHRYRRDLKESLAEDANPPGDGCLWRSDARS